MSEKLDARTQARQGQVNRLGDPGDVACKPGALAIGVEHGRYTPSARDEGGQRFRNGQAGQVADRSIGAIDDGQASLRDEHPDRLDRIQRDAVRASDDRRGGRRRESRHQPGEEFVHRGRVERLEIERGEVALSSAPVRPAVEQFGAG